MLYPIRISIEAMLALLLAGSLCIAHAAPQEVYPVRSGSSFQSLNGQWSFKYVAGSEIGPDATFCDPSFTGGAAWPSVAVPSHWELQGFAEPQYAKVDEGTGLYRRSFSVPAAWNGQRVFLHFDGVLYGFDAWVNGTKVGSWASAYNPVAFDITDALKPGAENVLAVRVTTRSHGWEFDTNDCWALSGIYRDVSLFAVPPAHFVDFKTETKLNPDGSAKFSVSTLTSAPAAVTGRLLDLQGGIVGQLQFSTTEKSSTAALTISHPRLWTAETPALYTLELTLSSGQIVSEKIGLREITIVDGILLLNGRPIKPRGVNHHDIWPINGRVATEELMRRDLELIQAANCNFVRTSHYPPHPRLIELCDELGLYVMDEVPFGFGEKHLTDPNYEEDLLVRARATVRRDWNRPSVIIWSVGNENGNTPLTFAAGRRVKELDPTRPICFPQTGSYFAKSYSEQASDVDVYAPHYPSLATVKDYATKLTRPVVFTEYAHALGLATDQVQAQWAVIQANPRLAGGAIWMFQDQGILRTATPTQTPTSTHNLGIAVWPDAQHYYDTAGNSGMDGIVYSDRTPQVDYWQVRKVYSPVQITAPESKARAGANDITIALENRFDFRSLEGIALNWTLRRNGTETANGSVPLRTPARTTDKVTIPFALPATLGADIFTLELRCADDTADSFYEHTVRLDTMSADTSRVALLTADATATKLTLTETAAEIRVSQGRFALTLEKSTGEIALQSASGEKLAGGFLPHVGRRFTEGEFMRAKRELTWTGAFLRATTPPESSAKQAGESVELRVRGRYARPDAPDQSLEGELILLVHSTGSIDVRYDYQVQKGQGMLLEAGLSLLVPSSASEFRWLGAGPYAGYPGKDFLNDYGIYHLSRPDLRFQGNRRGVELALLTQPTGLGVAMGGANLDVAVEREGENTIFSHNALVSGRGTKFVSPDTIVKAEATSRLSGEFTLLPLQTKWPQPLASWFDSTRESTKVLQPYFYSYDQ